MLAPEAILSSLGTAVQEGLVTADAWLFLQCRPRLAKISETLSTLTGTKTSWTGEGAVDTLYGPPFLSPS